MGTKLTPATVRALLDRATKGPWAVSKVRRGCAIIGDGLTVGAAHILGLGRDDERLANATLIASAPDLADAYLEAMVVIDGLMGPYCGLEKAGGEFDAAYDAASAFLAKHKE